MNYYNIAIENSVLYLISLNNVLVSILGYILGKEIVLRPTWKNGLNLCHITCTMTFCLKIVYVYVKIIYKFFNSKPKLDDIKLYPTDIRFFPRIIFLKLYEGQFVFWLWGKGVLFSDVKIVRYSSHIYNACVCSYIICISRIYVYDKSDARNNNERYIVIQNIMIHNIVHSSKVPWAFVNCGLMHDFSPFFSLEIWFFHDISNIFVCNSV